MERKLKEIVEAMLGTEVEITEVEVTKSTGKEKGYQVIAPWHKTSSGNIMAPVFYRGNESVFEFGYNIIRYLKEERQKEEERANFIKKLISIFQSDEIYERTKSRIIKNTEKVSGVFYKNLSNGFSAYYIVDLPEVDGVVTITESHINSFNLNPKRFCKESC